MRTVMKKTDAARPSFTICAFLAAALLFLTGTPAVAATTQLQTPITYSCVDTSIQQVLVDIADQAGIDIVAAPQVTGSVTFKVTDVPLEEVLTNILAANNYTFAATENMIRVTPIPEVQLVKEPAATKVYHITYADVNSVAAALSTFVSPTGRVAYARGTSTIIVTDTTDKIRAIDKFIEQIDAIDKQVLVEVRIYDIQTNEGFEIDTAWSVATASPLKTTDVRRTGTDTDASRSVTETFSEDQTETTTGTESMVGNYSDADEGPGSVTTNTNTTQVRDEDRTTTTTLPFETYRDTETQTWIEQRRSKPLLGASFDPTTGGAISFSLLDDNVNIDLFFSVLKKEVEAKLLANPRVLVLDNETADFDIVREVPYRELIQYERGTPLTYTAFKDIGVQLKVTPHIARDNMIRLHLEPEFGVLVGLNPEGIPTVDTRRANTVALIQDGQTIVVGGLKQRQTAREVSKVPVLGDLPLLGGAFRATNEIEQVNELVLFITTRIVTRPALTAIELRQFQMTNFDAPDLEDIQAEQQMTETMLRMLRENN
jgi:type IV pilus assembly protein PilQ